MSEVADKADSPSVGSRLTLNQLPRALISRRWWWSTILVIVGVIVLMRLGFWQLDRLEQRRMHNAQLMEQSAEPPLSLNRFGIPADVSTLADARATVEGRFDFSQQVILTQQNWRGAPGGHLITPMVIDGSDKAVLVNRGWVPSRALSSSDLSQFDEEAAQMIHGILQLTEGVPAGGNDVTADWSLEWYRVDIEAIEEQVPYELLPVYLLQSPTEGPDELPYRIEPEIDLSDGPHLSYAIQWFIFSALLGAGYLRYLMLHGANVNH